MFIKRICQTNPTSIRIKIIVLITLFTMYLTLANNSLIQKKILPKFVTHFIRNCALWHRYVVLFGMRFNFKSHVKYIFCVRFHFRFYAKYFFCIRFRFRSHVKYFFYIRILIRSHSYSQIINFLEEGDILRSWNQFWDLGFHCLITVQMSLTLFLK